MVVFRSTSWSDGSAPLARSETAQFLAHDLLCESRPHGIVQVVAAWEGAAGGSAQEGVEQTDVQISDLPLALLDFGPERNPPRSGVRDDRDEPRGGEHLQGLPCGGVPDLRVDVRVDESPANLSSNGEQHLVEEPGLDTSSVLREVVAECRHQVDLDRPTGFGGFPREISSDNRWHAADHLEPLIEFGGLVMRACVERLVARNPRTSVREHFRKHHE